MPQPPSPHAQTLRGALADAHAGRLGQASLKARLVLSICPDDAEAHYVLGIVDLRGGRALEAIGCFEAALRSQPSAARYSFALGMALDAAGRSSESVDAYRRALGRRPGHFETAANLGNVLERAERYAEAVEAYALALEARPNEALVINGLGSCLLRLQRHDDAERAFSKAIAIAPSLGAAHNNRSVALGQLRRHAEAIAAARKALDHDSGMASAWFNLGEQSYLLGLADEAVAALNHALDRDPGHAAAHFHRSAILGITVDNPPDDYIRSMFDGFAAGFDHLLTAKLAYRVPETLCQCLTPFRASLPEAARALDLGCGTGLSGLVLRGMSATLVGVDLSPAMLAVARIRNIYDALHERSLLAFLESDHDASWDLIFAANVFIYVGRLDRVFVEVARALAPAGLLAFSVEDAAESHSPGFRLQASGRFAHSRDYLTAVAKRSGLASRHISEITLRLDGGKPVPGLLAIFQKS